MFELFICLKLIFIKFSSFSVFYLDVVRVDFDFLFLVRIKSRFEELLYRYDNVFNFFFSGYNGVVGFFEVKVNMGFV